MQCTVSEVIGMNAVMSEANPPENFYFPKNTNMSTSHAKF
jgi:hypothetical protein